MGLQLRDLIPHQGNQGRDDNGQSIPQKRGQLVAERLAATRWHHGEYVSPIEDRADNVALARSEIREPKGLPQAIPRRVQISHSAIYTMSTRTGKDEFGVPTPNAILPAAGRLRS
jgi:hypothetical protein